VAKVERIVSKAMDRLSRRQMSTRRQLTLVGIGAIGAIEASRAFNGFGSDS
jgi:hypothetical protein